MKGFGSWSGSGLLAIALTISAVSVLYAAKDSVAQQSDQQQSQNQVQPGTEDETLKGQLISKDERYWTVETYPGSQMQIRVSGASNIDKDLEVGQWVEFRETPDRFAEFVKESSPGYTLYGDLFRIDGEHYMLTDASGREITFRIGGDAKGNSQVRMGDHVKLEMTPDGQAISIRPAKKLVGVTGG